MGQRTNRFLAGSIITMGCSVLVGLCIAVIYVIVHFIIKFW
jgi:hypothetical protein